MIGMREGKEVFYNDSNRIKLYAQAKRFLNSENHSNPDLFLSRLSDFFQNFGRVNQYKKILFFFFSYNLIVFLFLFVLNYTSFGKIFSLPYFGMLGTSRWIGMLFGIFFLNSIFSLGLIFVLQKMITRESFHENIIRNYLLLTLVLMLWATFRLSDTVCVEGECKTGKGKLAYKSGEIYEGDLVDYQANGIGKIFYLNGDIYSGEMESGKAHGKGILTLNNSKEQGTIDSIWYNGKLNGEAKKTLFPENKVEYFLYRDGKISEK